MAVKTFTNSLKYLLSIYYVPDTFIGAVDGYTSLKKQALPLMGLHFSWRQEESKQIGKNLTIIGYGNKLREGHCALTTEVTFQQTPERWEADGGSDMCKGPGNIYWQMLNSRS